LVMDKIREGVRSPSGCGSVLSQGEN
jgi:hypothetical protein